MPAHYVREYEMVYIARADVTDDALGNISERLTDVVGRNGGTMLKFENWGRRELAYMIQKQRKGNYYYLRFLGGSGIVRELERNAKLIEGILRFLTVQLADKVDPAARTPEFDAAALRAESAAKTVEIQEPEAPAGEHAQGDEGDVGEGEGPGDEGEGPVN